MNAIANDSVLVCPESAPELSHYSDDCGKDCEFYRLGELGLKTYDTRREAVRQQHVQHQMSLHGLAPKCGHVFKVKIKNRSSRHGFYTELATVAQTLDYQEWTRMQAIIEGCGDCERFPCEYGKQSLELRNNARLHGFHLGDVHSGNFGIMPDGRVVMIDVGCCYHTNDTDTF